VFDHGRIVEEGSHDALLRKSQGHYRRLFERQAGRTADIVPGAAAAAVVGG
jgi:ATP-binding cassette subfamily B protein